MDNLATKLMRFTLLLVLATFVSVASFGQSVGKLMKQGNKKFDREEYREAIPFYEKVLAQEPNNALALFRAGVSYLTYDKEKSIDYVNRAVKMNPKVTDDVEYWLGRVAHINYNFDEAIAHYRAFERTLKKRDDRREELAVRINHARNAKEQFNNQKDVYLKNLGPNINTAYSEHSPVISSDDNYLLFTTRAEESAVSNKKQEGEYFEHIVESVRDENGEWSKPRPIQGLNSKGHDASIMLFDNDQKLLMYRQERNGDIYVAERQGEAGTTGAGSTWSTPKALDKNINTKAFQSDAYLTPDGQTLLFSTSEYSDNGDLDIYFSTREGDKWSKPQSIGPSINTPFDDDSPYLSKDGNTLYFASRGHNTMGGYDIFKSERQGNTWGKAENMGYPVNSPDDDTYYRLSPDGTYAYLSSYRIGGYGEKDIWTINYISNVQIRGVVRSERDSSVVPGVEVVYSGTTADKKAISVRDVTKPDSGNYMVNVLSGRKYQITLNQNGKTVLTDEFDVPVATNDTTTFTRDFWLPYVMTADDSLALLGKNAFRNIYFDTDIPRPNSDDAGLRPESITELNRVVKVMQQYPKMTLYIDGHTDSRNTDSYNQRLSERRANAAYKYLIDNGIAKNRLTKRAYGEKRPVAPNDSPENMQLNRRTEFNIKDRGVTGNANSGTSSTGTNRNAGTTTKPRTTGTNTNTGGTNNLMNTSGQGGELKIKSGDTKIKQEEGELKIKSGDTKIKQEEGEFKIKSGDTKVKVDGDERKYKNDATDTKIKQEDGEFKYKSGDTKIKIEKED